MRRGSEGQGAGIRGFDESAGSPNLKRPKHFCCHGLESLLVFDDLLQRHKHCSRLDGAINLGHCVTLQLLPAKSQPGTRNLEQLVHMAKHGFSGPCDDRSNGIVLHRTLSSKGLDPVFNACNSRIQTQSADKSYLERSQY